jgi:hypothetical protein
VERAFEAAAANIAAALMVDAGCTHTAARARPALAELLAAVDAQMRRVYTTICTHASNFSIKTNKPTYWDLKCQRWTAAAASAAAAAVSLSSSSWMPLPSAQRRYCLQCV